MNSPTSLKIEYSHTDYDDLLKHYSRIFKTRYANNELLLPDFYGEGKIKMYRLPNGLQCLIGDYKVKQDAIFQRKRSEENYFVLRFDEVGDEMSQQGSNTAKSAVSFTSTNFDWMFYETKGAVIRSLNILLSESWLNELLGHEPAGENIKKFLALKIKAFNYEPMDKEYKQLLREAIGDCSDERYLLMHLQNRVMLLIERFFANLTTKMNNDVIHPRLSSVDIKRMKEVEQVLLSNFSVPPGINKLAKVAIMSQTKLKSSFKEVFGLSVYQYFQKHRMHKAKAMLVSRKYTLKQVSVELGYENVNSFVQAYKKVFGQSPAKLK